MRNSRWTSPWFWLAAAVCVVVFVFFVPVRRCPTCDGRGQDLNDELREVAAYKGAAWNTPCSTCSGEGALSFWRTRDAMPAPAEAAAPPDRLQASQWAASVEPGDTIVVRFLASNPTDQERIWRSLDFAVVGADGVVCIEGMIRPKLSLKPGHKKLAFAGVRLDAAKIEAVKRSATADLRLDFFDDSELVGSCPVDLARLEKPKPTKDNELTDEAYTRALLEAAREAR